MRVVIIGGGIGGLCLANALKNANIDVHVFERQTNPSENLAGYGLHIDKNGKKALLNCLPKESWNRFNAESSSAGVQLTFRDPDLRLLAERNDAKLTGLPAEQVERRGIGRTELRDILLDGLKDGDINYVNWGSKFENYEKLDNGKVLVNFEGGMSIEADVLIGADGSRSKVREQYLPDVVREELGIFAIAGRFVLDNERMKALPTELTNGSLNNIVPKGKGWMFSSAWHGIRDPKTADQQTTASKEHFVLWAYPVPVEDTLRNIHCLNASDLQSIALKGIASWSPELQRLVRECDLSTVTAMPLRSMPHLEPWTPTNITLIGDAIHNMTPMAGVGANTALRDAELLSRLLIDASQGQETVQSAIATYEERMRDYANAAVGLSKRNALAATSSSVIQRRGFRFLLRMADAVPPIMKATIGSSVIKA